MVVHREGALSPLPLHKHPSPIVIPWVWWCSRVWHDDKRVGIVYPLDRRMGLVDERGVISYLFLFFLFFFWVVFLFSGLHPLQKALLLQNFSQVGSGSSWPASSYHQHPQGYGVSGDPMSPCALRLSGLLAHLSRTLSVFPHSPCHSPCHSSPHPQWPSSSLVPR